MNERPMNGYWERVAPCVSAAAGDAEALRRVAGSTRLSETAAVLRLGSVLALAAERLGVDPLDDWRRRLQATMTGWLVVDRTARRVGQVLAEADIVWVPLKGYDVGTRFYDPREERPTGDLDVLVAGADLPRARQVLSCAGFEGLESGTRVESYLRDEGYAWQAVDETGTLLEVHFRLWGLVPEGLDRELLADSAEDTSLGGTARRLRPAHAFVLAAVHGWTQERPRSLADWRDLERIARREPGDLAASVVDLSRRWELELPVTLSASVVERLWLSPLCGEIVAMLEPELTRGERRLLLRLGTEGVDALSWPRIVLARLLGGRASRAGWRVAWRQFWPHPVVVERATPRHWSWPRRRLHHLGASLGRR